MIVMINLLPSNNHEQVDMTHTHIHNLNARSTIIVELFLE